MAMAWYQKLCELMITYFREAYIRQSTLTHLRWDKMAAI